jgi:hypothetical protein
VFIPIGPPFLKHSPLFNGNSLDRTFSAEGGHTASMPFRRPPAFPDQITLYREKVGPPEDIGIGRIPQDEALSCTTLMNEPLPYRRIAAAGIV